MLDQNKHVSLAILILCGEKFKNQPLSRRGTENVLVERSSDFSMTSRDWKQEDTERPGSAQLPPLQYKTYNINKGGQRHCSFVFTDTMGLEAGGGGVSEEDLKLALRGHVEEGYKFNPERRLTEGHEGYNSSPSLADKVHVLVVVLPVTSIDILSDDVWRKLREVRLAASDLGIPQMAILTKVDEACPDAKRDVRDVYRSIYLKEQVDKFHQQLGLPINCIFLVKNYVSELDTSDVMDAQILLALRQMIRYGEDFLNNL